jgi:beta-ureidopropionase / N-carbamoyl-L-amino-acid hydrolase
MRHGEAAMMSDEAAALLAQAVDESRLWQHHMDLARIGATEKGGVNRQALTADDARARAALLGWAEARGFRSSVDQIGNLFIRRDGAERNADPVMTGSHLDTQPTGGRFDGVYGVLAGFEVMEAMSDVGWVTRRPIDTVVWMNEEGSRFQPTTMGSAVFAGALSLERTLAVTDAQGVTVAEALARTLIPASPADTRPFAFPASAYIEAHIEQGPVLEAADQTIGVVTGIQGLRWFGVEVLGQSGHAGTTPRSRRRDALSAAVAMVTALEQFMADQADIVRFTVGRFEVAPNSPNTVPNRVYFTIDLRHPDAGTLGHLGDHVEAICRGNAKGCDVKVTQTLRSEPTDFAPAIVAVIEDAAARLRLPNMRIASGATHDAKFMAGLYPTGMIFVPCREGLSHIEDEYASPEHLAAGARVLAEALAKLAG